MSTVMNMKVVIENIRKWGLIKLKSGVGVGEYGCDLHGVLYNSDYYKVYSADAESELESYGVFNAIRKVKEYEESNFGECTTELHDPVKLCNMLAYIIGEEFLMESDHLSTPDCWDRPMDEFDINMIISELKGSI